MADDHNELLLTINDDGEEDSVTVDAQPTFKHGMCILLTQGLQLLFFGVFTYFANWILHNPMCTAMFRCGCLLPPPLGVGWMHCNVHNKTGPRCPWCLAPPISAWTTEWLPSLAMFGTALYLSYNRRPRTKEGQQQQQQQQQQQKQQSVGQQLEEEITLPTGRQVAARTMFAAVIGLLPWTMVSIIVGLAFKVHAHYPYFFVK